MLKAIGSLILAVILLSACAGKEPSAATPTLSPFYQEKLKEALQLNLTDKQREVLSDGWVTDEEWTEISSDFHACLEPTETEAELGTLSLSYKPTSARQAEINRTFNQDSDLVTEQFDKDLALMDECANSSIFPIGLLYFEPRNNPDGVPGEVAIQRCFEEQGITDLDGIPENELFDFIFSGTYNYQSTPERLQCVTNPQYGEYAPHNN